MPGVVAAKPVPIEGTVVWHQGQRTTEPPPFTGLWDYLLHGGGSELGPGYPHEPNDPDCCCDICKADDE